LKKDDQNLWPYQCIVEYLLAQKTIDIKLIYLFGSRAQGVHINTSDWDVAMLCAEPIENVRRWELSQNMAERLNSDVDLIDLLSCSTVLQKQVIDSGVVLYDANNYADAFDMQVISMYARLQEGRKQIIDSFVGKLKR
jgi:predicted nucleotidyltransferase